MTTAYKEAWFSLTRLGGCNYRQPVQRQGRSVIVADPQHPEQHYRLDAARFDADKGQVRGSWYIKPWTAEAARVTESEKNWQT